MGESSRVTVRIYGQEYTIAGGSTGEQILLVANHVDKMMQELAEGAPTLPASSLAVLTAVNIANDYFDERERSEELESTISDLKKDANHYIQMWEDAKASFKQYKEDAQNSIEQLQELQRIYNMKNVELNKANEALEDMKERCEELKADLAEAKEQLARSEESKSAESAGAKELRDKYKELESSFFDIQMENLQLKNDLDELKKEI